VKLDAGKRRTLDGIMLLTPLELVIFFELHVHPSVTHFDLENIVKLRQTTAIAQISSQTMTSQTNGVRSSAITSINGQSNGASPKITLYTNHGCPWAHRAHITLKELGLPYDEVLIDLNTPREEWYLKINPRGLVPSIKYDNGVISEIVTESAVVSQFLADSFPSHLLPASHSSPTAALTRAKIAFFVDAFFTKVNGKIFEGLRAEGKDKSTKSTEVFEAIKKEIEPLLKNASPYFDGAEKMTLAEALTAPFVLRLHAYSTSGLLPEGLNDDLKSLPNYTKWADNLVKQESVIYIWNEEDIVKRTKARMEKMKQAAK
jgi:glutathione S-transferase